MWPVSLKIFDKFRDKFSEEEQEDYDHYLKKHTRQIGIVDGRFNNVKLQLVKLAHGKENTPVPVRDLSNKVDDLKNFRTLRAKTLYQNIVDFYEKKEDDSLCMKIQDAVKDAGNKLGWHLSKDNYMKNLQKEIEKGDLHKSVQEGLQTIYTIEAEAF